MGVGAAHNEGHVSDTILKNDFIRTPHPLMLTDKPLILIRWRPSQAVPRPSGKISARPRARRSGARAQARAERGILILLRKVQRPGLEVKLFWEVRSVWIWLVLRRVHLALDRRV